jgi:signal transduction histidine kinase
LRTPLAGQRVVLESMLKREKFDEEYLRMALRENERLGDLSEEFLTFSRLERGVLEMQLETFDLAKLVKSGVDDFLAQHDDVEVTFLGDEVVEVKSDKAAISTVVRNLLENAWKYSAAPHEVEVSVFEGGFSVKDRGVGLSAVEQKKIFRQFYRVEQKLSRSQDGLGLGLSIVKRLVDAMGGRIEVESERGRGSTFTVFLEEGELR